MKLGGRFDLGHDFSSVVPDSMLAKIAQAEAALSETEKTSARWTLAWLEGQPVLSLDNGPTIRP